MVTKAQLKAQAKYDKQNTKEIILKLNNTNDADIIAKLSNTKNKQGYIKELVRNNMKNEKGVLTIDSIKCLLLPIAKKYALKTLILFGSYARNEATPKSDVDLIVDGGNYKGLIEYMAMIDAMKEAVGRDVDVITRKSLKENNKKSDKLFKESIKKDCITLYDVKNDEHCKRFKLQ